MTRIKQKIYSLGYRLGILSPNQIYSDEWFKKMTGEEWKADAENVVAPLINEFDPDSVIDFGCGVGLHLSIFMNNDIKIKGIDGSKSAIDQNIVPKKYLEQADLRNKYNTSQEYDLVLCFEVAEHLPGRHADTLIRTLTNAGETVAFTAATPGQGGTHHVNEKPRSYWIEKFESFGFSYDNMTVTSLRKSMNVEKQPGFQKIYSFLNRNRCDLKHTGHTLKTSIKIKHIG
jgi:trans-aconitate methyltransferase